MHMGRLFEMVYLLIDKKNITAKELAEHFEVSARTIYRDIDTLSQSGIPIYANKGRGGGIRLLDNFVLNKSVLTNQERSEILWALQGINAVKGSDGMDIYSRLRSLFGAVDTNWIEVDFSDWSHRSTETFAMIKQAVIQKRLLEFDYYNSYGQKTHRQAEPLQLWFKDRAWYLKAHCRKSNSLRLFKANRMKQTEILEEHFERDLPPDEKERENAKSHLNHIEVKLHLDASQGFRAYDEFDEEQVYVQEDGSFQVVLDCPEDEWVYGYILSYGSMAEVIWPDRIRDNIKLRLSQMQKLYE